ncbi:ABC transporter permease [Arthrobacter sp. KNU40]|uniref:ABC transporter permease n=1 Tax=Arthrobacter sp. KNU40 TaxID=3447965 RepID=UPI003F5E9DD2
MTTTKSPKATETRLVTKKGRAANRTWVPVTVATVLLFIVTWVAVPEALTRTSLAAMLPLAAVMALAGVGQTMVVQLRGIDLSTGGMITLAGTMTAVLGTRMPLLATLALVLIASVAVGILNGWLIARMSVTPLIATLSMASVLTGVVWLVSDGGTAPAPKALVELVDARFLGLPMIAWISVVVVVIFAVLLKFSVFGRSLTISGASERAARVVGVKPFRYTLAAYTASAVLSGLGGVLLVAYLRNSSLSMGSGYQLSVVAAVVVGGTSLLGGRGSVVATAIGSVFLSQLVQTAMTLGAPSSLQLLLQSAAIAIAAAVGVGPLRRPLTATMARMRRLRRGAETASESE